MGRRGAPNEEDEEGVDGGVTRGVMGRIPAEDI
jgi:hypothetical protein